jgi:hypothetical protein
MSKLQGMRVDATDHLKSRLEKARGEGRVIEMRRAVLVMAGLVKKYDYVFYKVGEGIGGAAHVQASEKRCWMWTQLGRAMWGRIGRPRRRGWYYSQPTKIRSIQRGQYRTPKGKRVNK